MPYGMGVGSVVYVPKGSTRYIILHRPKSSYMGPKARSIYYMPTRNQTLQLHGLFGVSGFEGGSGNPAP